MGAINPAFLDATSSSFFSQEATDNFTLYPRQSIFISFCVTVRPFCDGRPNPTPSGSGVNFTSIFNINTNKGNVSGDITLTDFHSTESVVTAGLFIPEFNDSVTPDGVVNPDGTYDYNNRVIISNQGPQTANNVNF
ncbi:MAG: hypothetical protein HC798_04810 [Polaribacter sp.]|nr:hypothetical protein [Polaribacter sp.]